MTTERAPDGAAIPLPDAIRRFLETPRIAAISTIDPTGGPHLAFIWYAVREDGLLVNSRRDRQWPRNLLRDPRVYLGVRDEANPYHWVGVEGRAELVHAGVAAIADIEELARRYGAEPQRYQGQDRVSFLIRPTRTYEYGG